MKPVSTTATSAIAALRATLAIALACALPAPAFAAAPAAPPIERIEPASWWTGMHHRSVQLMVHGAGIGALDVALDYRGVTLGAVTRVANPNYLFIELTIDANAAPGTLDLVFTQDKQRGGAHVSTYRYPLAARAPLSAQRAGFSRADAIYQLMPDRWANGNPANDNVARLAERADRNSGGGRHGGDLQGMEAGLDYVAAMGFTQIWPTPLVENDMPAYSYHGYAATDLYRVDERYGSNDDYRRYVAAARARGIGVIQDVVLNHIGSRHWWMRDLPTPDWITHGATFVPTSHHRTAVQDRYASQQDKRDFTAGWFSQGMPDLNQANPLLATYLIQNSIWWIEYAGLSGLRVDTYGYSDNGFLAQWSGRIMAEYPKLNLVGEEWSTQASVVARWQRGKQNFDGYVSHMPSMMDFPLNDMLVKSLASKGKEEPQLTRLYETLSLDHLYADPGQLVLFEGNHDLSRLYSLLHEDEGLYRMAIAYVLTMPRIPQFYYGTEIQMTSSTGERDDASYRHDFPGGWAGDAVNAFTGAGLTARQLAAQAYVKKLLNWRKTQPVIHHGQLMHYGPENDTYVYFRYDGARKILVALNKNAHAVALPVARFHEMLAGVRGGTDVVSGQRHALDTTLAVPARGTLILELDAR